MKGRRSAKSRRRKNNVKRVYRSAEVKVRPLPDSLAELDSEIVEHLIGSGKLRMYIGSKARITHVRHRYSNYDNVFGRVRHCWPEHLYKKWLHRCNESSAQALRHAYGREWRVGYEWGRCEWVV